MPSTPHLTRPAGEANARRELVSQHFLDRLEHFGVKLGLERVHDLLVTAPDDPLGLPTILVGGTNGKGSTSSLLESIARAAGLRTGLFTSPHLEDVRERIRIDGVPIADADLAGLLRELLERAEQEGLELPTYFESFLLNSLTWFRRSAVDLAILEVGLGGRLDATNATDPAASIVTSIGLDHTRILGDTLAAIAREKAGIFRPGRPAFAWVEDAEAEDMLLSEAERIGARLTLAHRICEIQREDERVHLTIGGTTRTWPLALEGVHQARNLALAVLAVDALAATHFPQLDDAAIGRGAANARWPGRLERVDLPNGGSVLLDAAHNPHGIEALVAVLQARNAAKPALLFGSLGDRDGRAMLARLKPWTSRRVLTCPDSPRAADPALLDPGDEGAVVEPDLAAALTAAIPAPGETLLVAGSIYLIGSVRRLLRERFGVPPATV